jgi:HEPN domain-containing protein
MNDAISFHCQQAAEKYLKALLQESGQPVPRTHNLVALQAVLLPMHPSIRSLRRGLEFMTRFAVDARYPGHAVTRRQATSALRWSGRVRDTCRAILGLPPPPRRRGGR